MRWIVDTMNVIGARPDGWWRDRGRATAKLLAAIDAWAVATGEDVTVVLESPPKTPMAVSVVRVEYAPRAAPNSGDDEIVRLVQIDEQPAELTVVTSDVALAQRVRSAGAAVFPSRRFRDLVDPSA